MNLEQLERAAADIRRPKGEREQLRRQVNAARRSAGIEELPTYNGGEADPIKDDVRPAPAGPVNNLGAPALGVL